LPTKGKGGRGNVDGEFFKRVKRLIEIVVPGWTTPEAKILLKLSVLLVARTILSIWLADVNGAVVKAIVDIKFPEFCRAVRKVLCFNFI
jgi:ATP-binding cassette, subfamily D (ALD), peroxisomal long-chain fatty acid import protein